MGQCQSKGHGIGRWAHVNVKLHFLTISNRKFVDFVGIPDKLGMTSKVPVNLLLLIN